MLEQPPVGVARRGRKSEPRRRRSTLSSGARVQHQLGVPLSAGALGARQSSAYGRPAWVRCAKDELRRPQVDSRPLAMTRNRPQAGRAIAPTWGLRPYARRLRLLCFAQPGPTHLMVSKGVGRLYQRRGRRCKPTDRKPKSGLCMGSSHAPLGRLPVTLWASSLTLLICWSLDSQGVSSPKQDTHSFNSGSSACRRRAERPALTRPYPY